LANTEFQTMYNRIGLGLEPIAWRHAPVIWNLVKWNSVKWNETRRIGAILHASASRGFVSVSWAFLFLLVSSLSRNNWGVCSAGNFAKKLWPFLHMHLLFLS